MTNLGILSVEVSMWAIRRPYVLVRAPVHVGSLVEVRVRPACDHMQSDPIDEFCGTCGTSRRAPLLEEPREYPRPLVASLLPFRMIHPKMGMPVGWTEGMLLKHLGEVGKIKMLHDNLRTRMWWGWFVGGGPCCGADPTDEQVEVDQRRLNELLLEIGVDAEVEVVRGNILQ